MNRDATFLRKFLFEATRTHLFRSTTVDNIDTFGAETFALHGDIDRCHATTYNHDPSADRQRTLVIGLPNVGDIVDRIFDTRKVFIVHTERVHRAEADADKHSVVLFAQVFECEIDTERHIVLDLDSTDRQDVVNLTLREIIDRLVGGNAVLVQSTELAVPVQRCAKSLTDL